MGNMQQKEVPEQLGIFSITDPEDDRAVRVRQRKQQSRLQKQYQREVRRQQISYIPGTVYAKHGAKRKANFRGGLRVGGQISRTTSFTLAGAYPFVASGSLGVPGVCMGKDVKGGGGFFFDPWELYKAKVIKGMSMVTFGSVGMGKSTAMKSLVSRLVLAGRRALIMTDKKGEWGIVSQFLGGKVITVGPGMNHRINPLDEGTRPSTDVLGAPMTDENWEVMVWTRRLSLLRAVAQVLIHRQLEASEDKAIRTCLERAVEAAEEQGRVPTIPDVLQALNTPDSAAREKASALAAHERMADALSALVEGHLRGMFDGPSTVVFDAQAPMVVFNTQALEGVDVEAKKIVYACTQSWAEAAVTSRDFGQRCIVYEEGLDVLNDAGSLSRMVAQFKLARAYGIFNILVLHKIGDLDIAGDEGSKTRAEALSLLGDSDIRVIYHQNSDQIPATKAQMKLTDRECAEIENFGEGMGLWKLGNRSFVVKNILTNPEKPIFDTDKQMATTSTTTPGQ